MAKSSRNNRSSQGGSTMYGVLAGLLIGLILAAAVAFYVTKAPMPFVDRATRETSQAALPDPRQAPDPNTGLYGRSGPAGTPSTGPTDTPIAPLPGAGQGQPGRDPDDLGALIASLPKPTAEPAPLPPPKPVPAPAQSSGQANGSYFLQVGAYRVLEDAEALRARILLLGLPVQLQRAEVNGLQINRVRVGPYARLDDMNRTRARLGEEKIESTVVRQ